MNPYNPTNIFLKILGHYLLSQYVIYSVGTAGHEEADRLIKELNDAPVLDDVPLL